MRARFLASFCLFGTLAALAHSQCSFTVPSTATLGVDVQTYLDGQLSGGDVTVCLNASNTYTGTSSISMVTGGGGSVTLLGRGGGRPLVNYTTSSTEVFAVTSGTDASAINIEFLVPNDLATVANASATLTLTSVYVHGAATQAIDLTAALSLAIVDSEFNDNTGSHGGCVRSYTDAEIVVVGSNFTANAATTQGGVVYMSGGGSLAFLNSTFSNNEGDDDGGVAFVSSQPASIDIDGGTFLYNSAYGSFAAGGCVYTNGLSGSDRFTMSVANSEFVGNFATGYAAAVGGRRVLLSVSNCSFTHSVVRSGTVAVYTGAMDVSGCVFRHNSAASGSGGALYGESGVVITLTDNIIEDSSTSASGGCMYVYYLCRINITSTAFRRCVTAGFPGGGAIDFDSDHAVSVTNATFEECTADSDGGALHFVYPIEVAVASTSFLRCSSNDYGGAVYVGDASSAATFVNCAFESNAIPSGGSGSAIVVDTIDAQLHMQGCVFANNTGGEGAVVSFDVDVVLIEACVFQNNTCNDNCGTFTPWYAVDVRVLSSRFVGNILLASFNVGGVNLPGVTYGLVDGCSFEDGYGADSSGVGVRAAYSANIDVRNSNFVNTFGNTCADLHLDANYVNVTNIQVTDSTSNGSASVCVNPNLEGDIDGLYVTRNNNNAVGALETTGGLYTISNSVFAGNTARGGEAGALKLAGTAHLDGVVVEGNVVLAAGNGGGVYIDGASVSVGPLGCVVRNNTASGNGGGVYTRSTADGSAVSGMLIEGNTASIGGGVYVDVSAASFANTTIRGNVAVTQGGGLVAAGGVVSNYTVVTMVNSEVSCNSAPVNSTAGVHANDYATILLTNSTTVANNYEIDVPGDLFASFISYPDDILANIGSESNGAVTGYVQAASEDPRFCLGLLCSNSNDPCVNNGSCVNTDPNTDLYGPTSCDCSGSPGIDLDEFCFPEPCGNGFLDNGETCDDGNRVNNDGCDANCTLECGNGMLNANETCDDGNRVNSDGCDANCTVECGNGQLDGVGETCDDGNRVNDDGCDANCTLECGNGRLDGGETCDDTNTLNDDGCDANCTLECGNGRLDGGETCDDTNTLNDDGCDANCTLECGNNQLDGGETCDDGNVVSNDGCDSNCVLECGNGQLDGAEECDDSGTANGDGCDSACLLECGNNQLDGAEACDDGNTANGDGCDSNCLFECGNNQLDGAETCDDGNRVSGDGCSSTCKLERAGLPEGKCRDSQWEKSKGNCEPCPYGGYCNGGPHVLPLPGFWSPHPSEPPTECPVYDACPGVVDEDGEPIDPPLQYDSDGAIVTSVCGNDYADAVCSKCESKRLKDGQRCVPCPSDAASTAGGLVFVTAVLIVVLAIAVAVLPDNHLDKLVAATLVAQMFVLVGRDATKHIPGEAGRRASAVYRYFSVITFDIDFMQLGCSREEALDFADVFWGTLALVAIASALFSLAAFLNVVQHWLRGKLRTSFATSLVYHVVHVNVLLGVAAYVQISLRVLQSVNCISVYGKPRLHVELATECYSGKHAALSFTAWALMLGYVVAFPVFVLYIAWMRPAELRVSESVAERSKEKVDSYEEGSAVFSVDYSEHTTASAASAEEEEEADSDSAGSDSAEEEQQSSVDSSGDAVVSKPDAAEAYRAKYGFLIRNLHKHAYWFQALRLIVVFVVVLDVVVPRNTSFKLLGGVIVLVVNVVVVGLVWPFKSRFGNIFQVFSGLTTALQTVVFMQEVVDPRYQSAAVFFATLGLLILVTLVIGVNMFRNKSLLFKETSSASDSWVAWSGASLFASTSSSTSGSYYSSSGSESGSGSGSGSGYGYE